MTVEEEAAAKQVEADKAKKAEEDAAKAKAAQGDEAKETVPKAEHDKLLADIANFKRIEEERKAKEKKRQEELLAEQGKFKELYETAQRENVAMKTRLEAQDAVFKTMLGDELKDLPEDFDKTLIPAGESYDQLVWVRKARPMMVPKAGTSRAGDGTPPPAKPGDLAHGMRGIYTHPTSPKH